MKRGDLPFFTLDVPIVDRAAWDRIRRQIQRKHGQRVKIKRVGEGYVRVIATVEMIDDDYPCRKLTTNAALTLMAETINAICTFGDSKRPIATSREWKLPEEDKSDFDFITGMPAEARRGEIIDSVRELGYDPQTRRPKSPFMPWTCDFHILGSTIRSTWIRPNKSLPRRRAIVRDADRHRRAGSLSTPKSSGS